MTHSWKSKRERYEERLKRASNRTPTTRACAGCYDQFTLTVEDQARLLAAGLPFPITCPGCRVAA